MREIGSADLKGSQLQKSRTGLLLSEGDAVSQQSGGTWSSIFFSRWLPDWITPVVWYLGAQLFAFIVLPIAFVVFRPWPDRGYLFAKPLGLVLVATLTWLLVSTNIV